MAIKIYASVEKGAIFFEGSRVDPKFLGTIVAEAHPTEADRVVVSRNDRTEKDGVTFRKIFKRLKISRIENEAGENLVNDLGMDRAGVLDYINEQATLTGATSDLVLFDKLGVIDFYRDPTNTSIVMSNGDHYGVNAIKAVEGANGLIHITTKHGDETLYEIEIACATINGTPCGTTLTSCVNALNALFTVSALGNGVDPLPSFSYEDGVDITVNTRGTTDPEGADIYASEGPSHGQDGAAIWSSEVIDHPGEYFTVKVNAHALYGIGLYDAGTESNDLTEIASGGGNGHSGYFWSNWLYRYSGYTQPWTWYGSNVAGSVYGPGWTGATAQKLNGSPAGDHILNSTGELLLRVGINADSFIELSYYDVDRTNDWIVLSRSGHPTPEGQYGLLVKLGDQYGRILSLPQLHELAITEEPTVGTSALTLFGTATGDITGSGVVSTDASDYNDGFILTDAITQAGQYYEITDFNPANTTVGLWYEGDTDEATLLAAMGTPGTQGEFYFLGQNRNSAGQMTSVYRQDSGQGIPASTGPGYNVAGMTHVRVGFDTAGKATIWASSDGVNYQVSYQHSSPAPSGSYRLLSKILSDGGGLGSVSIGQLSLAPTLHYRYVESPDGQYTWPLFATEEEANYVDEQNGGAGASSANVFPDDATSTSWYLPDRANTDGDYDGDGSFYQDTDGVRIAGLLADTTYTEIPTGVDADFLPPVFDGADQSFTEGTSVNLQLSPQDVSYTTSASGLPSGLSVNALGMVTGTTPYVSADTDYTVTVTRTNDFGSISGNFVLTVSDDPVISAINGWTVHQGNTVGPATIKHDEQAVLQYDTAISQGQEFTWNHIHYPVMGILNATGLSQVSTTDLADHHNSHWDLRFSIWANGTVNHLGGVGWTDNGQIGSGATSATVWTLRYNTDGSFELLNDGNVVVETAAGAFTGDQDIYLAANSSYSVDTYVPQLTVTTTVFSGDPPVGFQAPLTSGIMTDATTLGGDENNASVATMDMELGVNQRVIVTQAFVETHMLPFLDEGYDKNYFGVPKTSANWTSVDLHNDFDAVIRLEWQSGDRHKLSQTVGDSPAANHVTINSSTDAFYDYAIEWDGTDLHVIACNIADLLTEPGVNSGGSFARVYTYSGYSDRTGSLPLVFATKTGGQMGLSTAGINKIQIPFGVNHILVSEGSSGNGKFSSDSQAFLDGTQHDAAGSTFNPPTVNAGTTYTFVYDNSLEANDYIEFLLQGTTTPYTTGVTAFDNTVGGNPAAGDGYKGITFAVPADAPPLDVRFYNDFASSFDTQRELPISGSSYVVDVTGITTIGPAGNISGTDLTGDAWFKLDNDIDSGMRVTIDGPTLLEIYNQMDNGENVYVGIKDSANWTEGGSYEGIKSIYLKIHKPSYGGYFLGIYSSSNGSSYSYGWTNVESTVTNDFSAFIELTNSGNNIRAGITHSSLHTDDIATTPYSEWAGPKTQTGDQGFGISAEEFVFLFDHFSSTTDFDTSQVTWTDINEISNPTPPATMQTDWDHGIVFAGSNERMEQEGGGSYSRNPMYLSSGVTVPEHSTDGTLTSNHSSARPWAFSVVFKHAGNASNQHIFNHGEGSNGDNIYLRTSADRHLYFGWGIDGGANECKLMDDPLNTNRWYGVYVAHRGTRLQSGDATAANLAEAFDIYIVTSNTGFTSFDQGNRSTVTRWTNGSVGNRMNRSITGNTYLGGRDNNRSWHGKIAATVVTTLRVGDAMPGEAEILEMIRDPKAWLTNYKVGNWYRVTGQSFNNSDFQLNDIGAARATQVWLMGDGTSDAYAVIRNQVYPGDQNESAIRMLSMVSGDIENVAINGLT